MAAHRKTRIWSAAEEAHLRARVADGVDYPTIAAEIGRDALSVSCKARHMGASLTTARRAAPLHLPAATVTRVVGEADDSPVTVYAPEETADEPDDAFLARVLAKTGRAVQLAAAERFARVRIASDQPIALSLTSDWHLQTGGATDVAGLLAHAGAVAATDGAYTAAIGDLTDNSIKHRGGAGPAAVADELRLLDLVVGRYGRKMLWLTSGNHDDWTKAFAGVDNLRTLAQRRRLHYTPDELIAVVEIVDPHDVETVTARWVIATRHKYRRHSAMNVTHACWRWLEEMGNEWPTDADQRTLLPDVLAIGDNHVAAVETRSYPRGDVVACRMGAWQTASSFGRALGFASYRPTAPTVILHPTRARPPVAYADYREAFAVLAAQRALQAVAA